MNGGMSELLSFAYEHDGERLSGMYGGDDDGDDAGA